MKFSLIFLSYYFRKSDLRAVLEAEAARHGVALAQVAEEQRANLQEVDGMIEALSERAYAAIERFQQSIDDLRNARLHTQENTQRLRTGAGGGSAAAASSVGVGTISALGKATLGLAPVAGGGKIGLSWASMVVLV